MIWAQADRYATWSADKTESDKPDIILFKGRISGYDAGTYTEYEFKKGQYTYRVSEGWIPEPVESDGQLYVTRNGEKVLTDYYIETKYRN
jgi:hypothetical protein